MGRRWEDGGETVGRRWGDGVETVGAGEVGARKNIACVLFMEASLGPLIRAHILERNTSARRSL